MRYIICLLGTLFAFSSCTKLEDPILGLTNRVEISTYNPVTKVTDASASAGGNITKDGGDAIIERGVVWSTSSNPTTSLKERRKSGTGIGGFTVDIDTLLPFTDYYLRAYAINYYGTVYGQQVPFKTIKGAPRFSASSLVSKDAYNIKVSAFISLDGGEAVTSRGFCISQNANPNLLNSTILPVGNGTLYYEYTIPNLLPKTNYFIRPYATNSLGTAYGKQIEVSTEVGSVKIDPVFISNLEATSVKLTMKITSAEGGTISRKGFAISNSILEPFFYDENKGVTLYENSTSRTMLLTINSGPAGIGTFEANLTNLRPGTTYYVRAYAMNESPTNSGVSNTGVLTFTTKGPPSVQNINSSNLSYYSFVANARVLGDGGSAVTDRGFYVSTNSNPTINNSRIISVGGGSTGDFQSIINNLYAYYNYYFTAYATNAYGTTVAANPVQVTTLANTAPVINNIPYVGTINNRTFPISGQVDSDGGLPILERGFYYSRSNLSPNSSDLKVLESGSFAQGGFANSISNLVFGNVTYFVRSYARNALGTSVGPVTTFNTPVIVSPTVRNTGVSALASRSVTLNGVIDSDGYGTISSTGFLWSTNSSMSGATSISGSGNPNFSGSFTVLPNTTYWYQAFAKSEGGSLTSVLPNPSNFTTPCEAGVVSYMSFSAGTTSLLFTYNLTSLGGDVNVTRGVCYSSTNANPQLNGAGVTNLTGTQSALGTFQASASGLTSRRVYYAQAYVTNCFGTVYSGVRSFTTL